MNVVIQNHNNDSVIHLELFFFFIKVFGFHPFFFPSTMGAIKGCREKGTIFIHLKWPQLSPEAVVSELSHIFSPRVGIPIDITLTNFRHRG
jgi:hypothetical protein